MKPWHILLIILAIIVIVLVVLYFLGKRMEKKQAEQQKQMEAMKQNVSMLIIDKKRMRIKDSGLPQMVIDQTPKYMRRAKLPIVKAKVGPKIASFICEDKIFDLIPVKKEVKAVISGLYITDVRGLRGSLNQKPEKVGFFKRMKNKINGNK
ncbi:MAG TPA: hypothetical protein DF613_16055 [Lachnospiraceae bacterium]|nr:hypothetical protein [Lachnospiraceae bacterium]